MGMEFTVSITGTVEFRDIDASDAGIEADAVIAGEVGYGSSVEFEDEHVTQGTVTIRARASLSGYEVMASDIGDFDAVEALESFIDSYSVSVEDAEFDIEESPTGFSEVEQAVGRSTAIEVYAALAASGFEVN